MLSRHIGYQIDLGYNIKRGMPGAFLTGGFRGTRRYHCNPHSLEVGPSRGSRLRTTLPTELPTEPVAYRPSRQNQDCATSNARSILHEILYAAVRQSHCT